MSASQDTSEERGCSQCSSSEWDNLMDRLELICSRQTAAARAGDYAQLEQLCVQWQAAFAEGRQAADSAGRSGAQRLRAVIETQDRLRMMIAANKEELTARLSKLVLGRKTLRAYHKGVGK